MEATAVEELEATRGVMEASIEEVEATARRGAGGYC